MDIRKANITDVSRILEIYAPYIENTSITFEYEVPTLEDFTKRFKKISAEYPYLVAEENGVVVGYAYGDRAFSRAAYGWDADLSVYLDESSRGRGIGKALVTALEKELYQMGMHNIYAVITGDNASSRAFHEALGYKEAGILPLSGFKHGKWHDVYFYEKRIREADAPDPLRSPKYAIFDVDGTLLDSMGVWRRGILSYINGKFGKRDFGDKFESEACGMGVAKGIEYYKSFSHDETPTDEIVDFIKKQMHEQYKKGCPVKKGVIRLLTELKRRGFGLCVITATPDEMIHDALKASGLIDYFDFVVSTDTYTHGKDFPDVFNDTLLRFGNAKPSDTLLFEDALYSVKTAKALGIHCIGLYDDYNYATREELKRVADEYYSSLDEYCDIHSID